MPAVAVRERVDGDESVMESYGRLALFELASGLPRDLKLLRKMGLGHPQRFPQRCDRAAEAWEDVGREERGGVGKGDADSWESHREMGLRRHPLEARYAGAEVAAGCPYPCTFSASMGSTARARRVGTMHASMHTQNMSIAWSATRPYSWGVSPLLANRYVLD